MGYSSKKEFIKGGIWPQTN